jgi:acyl dehydratase
MNSFTFETIKVGQTAKFTAVITDETMAAFREITGDRNPLHCDGAYAARRGYEGRVVYGMLTASYLSTLAGMYLPGERSLIQQVKIDFLEPVILPLASGGTNITVFGEVTKKHEEFKRLTIDYSISDATGVKLARGTMKAGVAE